MNSYRMKLPKTRTIDDLITILEGHKATCEETLKTIKEALETLRHPEHIKYWKNEKDNFEREVKRIEERLKLLKKITKRK